MRGSILATRHAESSPQPSVSYPVLFNPIAKCYGFAENIYRGSEKGENRTAYAPASLKYRRMSGLPRRHWRGPKQTANEKKTQWHLKKKMKRGCLGGKAIAFLHRSRASDKFFPTSKDQRKQPLLCRTMRRDERALWFRCWPPFIYV